VTGTCGRIAVWAFVILSNSDVIPSASRRNRLDRDFIDKTNRPFALAGDGADLGAMLIVQWLWLIELGALGTDSTRAR
jgi:hypothetical protein